MTSQEHRVAIALLDKAIWSCTCTFCGATAGVACKQKPRSDHPPTQTKSAHMDRVRAAHAKLKATNAK